MSRKSKDLITINHLPGLLLASMGECEQWIEAGLIPIADRKVGRASGKGDGALLFDPEIVAQLAAEVPPGGSTLVMVRSTVVAEQLQPTETEVEDTRSL